MRYNSLDSPPLFARTWSTSPRVIMGLAYFYLVILALIFNYTGLYRSGDFFSWGPPITFFGQTITSWSTFNALHVSIFFHQIVNNWVNSVVYPWIMNSVQDPKTKHNEYSAPLTLLLINLFNIYSQVDTIFIVVGFTAQISFVLTTTIANILTSTYINYRYLQLRNNRDNSDLEKDSPI